MTGVQDAFTGDSYSVDGIYSLSPNCSVTVELYEGDVEKISKLVLGGELLTDAFGFGSPGLRKIDPADVPTLGIVPDHQKADGIGAASQIVLPAVSLESLASIVYNRPTPGGNSANSFTVTFKAAQRATDQSGAAIPASCQFAFMGPVESVIPANTWTYPTLAV